jgi:hypothetical protein
MSGNLFLVLLDYIVLQLLFKLLLLILLEAVLMIILVLRVVFLCDVISFSI